MMRVAARLRHLAGTQWGRRCYLDMSRLRGVKEGSVSDGPHMVAAAAEATDRVATAGCEEPAAAEPRPAGNPADYARI